MTNDEAAMKHNCSTTKRVAGRRIMRFSRDLLAKLFGEGVRSYRVVENAVPGDATVFGIRLSFDTWTVEVCLESKQWEDVPGALPQTLDPVIETLDPLTMTPLKQGPITNAT